MPAELDWVDFHGRSDGGGACDDGGVEGDSDGVGGGIGTDGGKHERVGGGIGAVDPASGGTSGDWARVGAIAVDGDADGTGVVAATSKIGICGVDRELWSSEFMG